MKDKLFNYGITIGLVISLIGLILLKTDVLADKYINPVHNLYKLTLLIAVLFILTKSLFIKENFNQILKVGGFIFLALLGINLLKEFNIYDLGPIQTIGYILFSSLPIMYTYYFLKNKNKKKLDYSKLGLVALLFACGFLSVFNVLPNSLTYLCGVLFGAVIVGMLYVNHEKEDSIKTYVG